MRSRPGEFLYARQASDLAGQLGDILDFSAVRRHLWAALVQRQRSSSKASRWCRQVLRLEEYTPLYGAEGRVSRRLRMPRGETDRQIARGICMQAGSLQELAGTNGWLDPEVALPDDEAIAATLGSPGAALET